MKQQRGDTIIEVLLAMSIVAMVLGAAYGIANRNLNIGRNSQERTEALKLAESQVELLKNLHATGAPFQSVRVRNDVFCIVIDPINIINNNACENRNSNFNNTGIYTVGIHRDNSSGIYKVEVTWHRIGSATGDSDSLSLFYKPRTP